MLKKRLVGVITVKSGWAVQSFGYQRHLPLGHPEFLAENLDRWGADEILVLSIDRTRQAAGPDFTLIRRLGGLGLSTPLSYGGGLRSVEDAGAVVQAGAERVCVDALLRSEPAVVRGIAALIGAQAVIGVLPLVGGDHGPRLLEHTSGRLRALTAEDLVLFNARVVSEALIIDCQHEGHRGAFDMELLQQLAPLDAPLIAFGGISEPAQLESLFAHERVAAVGVGNFLAYQEHAVQKLKRRTGGERIRPAASGDGSR